MSRRSRWKTTGRADHARFAGIPVACLEHPNYIALSLTARALLVEFARQYNGFNNGDLCCAWKLMKARGWKSRSTVERARDELLARGWIEQTRQGGRNAPNLYALTFQPIDECKGKLDVPPTKTASGLWRTGGLRVLHGYRQTGS